MPTPADNLRGNRILYSVIMHLRSECNRLRAEYRYEESNVIWAVIHDELYSTMMQLRADIMNVNRHSLTALDVPDCFPGF